MFAARGEMSNPLETAGRSCFGVADTRVVYTDGIYYLLAFDVI